LNERILSRHDRKNKKGLAKWRGKDIFLAVRITIIKFVFKIPPIIWKKFVKF